MSTRKERFINYVKDKPFYVINYKNGKPVDFSNVDGDGVGDVYYVGNLMGGNAIFRENERINVYYYENGKKTDSTYWVDTVIDNFANDVWVLVDWYKNNLTFDVVIKNLSSLEGFDPFNLNESNSLSHGIVLKPGTPIYCHTSITKFKDGNWYVIDSVGYGQGNNGEDVIRIYNRVDEDSKDDNWTIQKDENGLNYENWFLVGDTSFDTNQAFETLYESEDELEWAQDIVKDLSNGWSILKAGNFNTLDLQENFYITIKIKDYDYLLDSINECGMADLLDIIKNPNYKFTFLTFDRGIERQGIDCGVTGDEDLVTAVRLGFKSLDQFTKTFEADSFWFLEDWIDITFVPRNINEESISKFLPKETKWWESSGHIKPEEGDMYQSDDTLIMITKTDCRDEQEPQPMIYLLSGGKELKYYHDNCYLKYKISEDNGKTWFYEEEDGHWVERGWVDGLVQYKIWNLIQKNTDLFSSL